MGPDCVMVATDRTVADFLSGAKHRVVFLAPAVDETVAAALLERGAALSGGVLVILDSDPEAYRLGYGTERGLRMLVDAEQAGKVMLRRQPGLRLCLAIADARTLIFTPNPKLIEAGPNSAGSVNAVLLDTPPASLLDELAPSPGREPRVGREKLSSADSSRIVADLAENPPQAFDIARRMRVFNSYYEFVDLEIRGTEIHRRRVSIPNHLSGLADSGTRERLESTFRLVADNDRLSGAHLRKDRDRIAKRFLVSVPRWGAVIRRADKPAFLEMIGRLQSAVEAFQVKVEATLQEAIDKSRVELAGALLPAVARKPPREWWLSDGLRPDKASCAVYLEQDLLAAFGSAKSLVGEMGVRVLFRGITHETLNDKDFLAAAAKAGLDVTRLHDEYDAAKAQTQESLFDEAPRHE